MSTSRDNSPSPSEESASSNASNSLLETSRNLKDKWPENISSRRNRVAVAPSKEIENIPELSPAAYSQDEAIENNEDMGDGSPVYKTTTEPKPKNRRGRSSDDEAALIPDESEKFTFRKWLHSIRDWFKKELNSLRGVKFSSRQWIIMLVLAIVTLTSSFAVCLFPPFFPKIAQSKGASAKVFGPIIGTNCLVAFLVTPSVGKNVENIGVKFSFVMGAFAGGCCCILSGFLEWFPPGYEFVVEAVLIRAVHACSNAFVIISTFAFIVVEFPDNVAMLFALTRSMMNLAQLLGPIIGGALYDQGGFKLPFLVLGSVQMTVAIICIYALPSYRKKQITSGETNNKTIALMDVIKIPGMWISFCTFFFSTMSNGFLSITLEPLVLRKFKLTELHVGVLFGLKDGANSLASPFWGILCDRMKNLRPLILVSTVIAATSFILLGPFPGLPFETTHGIVVAALVINGFGIGGQQVSGVVHAMNTAVGAELPDNAVTHGFIAGLWSSLSGAGRFISRAGAGILVDQIGFQYGTAVVVSLHTIVFIVTICFMVGDRFKKPKPAGTEGKISPPTTHGPDCTRKMCVCEGSSAITSISATTPSEAMTSKAMTIPIPDMREDLENSIPYGSLMSNRATPPNLSSLSPSKVEDSDPRNPFNSPVTP